MRTERHTLFPEHNPEHNKKAYVKTYAFILSKPRKSRAFSARLQSVEKIEFAREAGILNPFFASALPRQKTLLSAQLCELSALPTMSADSADASAEKSQRDFFDGLKPRLFSAALIVKPV